MRPWVGEKTLSRVSPGCFSFSHFLFANKEGLSLVFLSGAVFHATDLVSLCDNQEKRYTPFHPSDLWTEDKLAVIPSQKIQWMGPKNYSARSE